MDEQGRVILLNGPSSSGKSSLGRAMLPLLDDPWFLVPVDVVSGMRSTVQRTTLDDARLDEVLTRTRRGYHRTVAALASAGNHVIMDYPLSEPWRLADLLVVLAGYDVTLVDVACSPAELERRERARGDRPRGLAATQRVYEHADRDLTIDTTATPPEKCAESVVSQWQALPRPKAFDRLRRGGVPAAATESSMASDREAIAEVATQYFESWFDGDPDRMRAVLHPALSKRTALERGTSTAALDEDTAEGMVAIVSNGPRTSVDRGLEVTVLDIGSDIATVKVVSAPFVEYLHLGRFGDRWLIVNALYEPA